MKTRTIYLISFSLLTGSTNLFAQGAGFIYQGRLNEGGNPANGLYDLSFTLFSVDSGGSVVAGPLTKASTGVTNGLFTVTLDFGPAVFNGPTRWLEIATRTNGAGAFTTLAPRQPLTPTPYALYAANAGTAASASVATNIKEGAFFTNDVHVGSIYQYLTNDNVGVYWSESGGSSYEYGINFTPMANDKLNIYSKKHISLSPNGDQTAGVVLQLGNTQGGYDLVNVQRNGSGHSGTNRPSKLLILDTSIWNGSAATTASIGVQNMPDAGSNPETRLWISKPLAFDNQAWGSGVLARSDTIGQINSVGSGWNCLKATNFLGVGSGAGSGAASIAHEASGTAALDVASGTYPGFLLGGVVSTGARTDGVPKVGVMSFAPVNAADTPVTGLYYDSTGGYLLTARNALMIGGGLARQGMNAIELYAVGTVGANSTQVPMVVIDEVATRIKTGATAAVATSYAKAGGILKTITTQTTTSGSTETDLGSFSVPASTLAENGDQLEFDAAGSFSNDTDAKRVTVYFGTDGVWPTDSNSGNCVWRVTGRIIRTGAATQIVTAEFNYCGVMMPASVAWTGPLSSAQTFKIAGQRRSGMVGSVTLNSLTVKWYPAN